MTEIAVRQPAPNQALSLSTMSPADAWRFAQSLAGAALLPQQYRDNPSSVLWAMEYGRALGVDVVTAINSVHVINGRPTASADLIAGLVRKAGHRLRLSGDDTRAVAVIVRADDPEFEYRVEWTVERAQRAQLLNKSTWKQFPAAMLRARAITEVARMACSEVLHGTIYTPEEVGANVDADGVPVSAPVEPLRAVPSQAAPAQRAKQAPSDDPWQTPPQPEATPVVDPNAQALADRAAACTDGASWRAVWDEAGANFPYEAPIVAPDTGEREPLGAYVKRVGDTLAAKLNGGRPVEQTTVVEGEVVQDDPDAIAHAQAEVYDAAKTARMNAGDMERQFLGSYGHAVSDATVTELREMRDLLLDGVA